MHVLLTPLSQLTTAFVLAVCTAATVWGHWPERSGAAAVALNTFGTILLQDRRLFHHGQPALFTLDAAMFLSFVWLVLASRRVWPLWAAACGLLLVLTHVLVLVDPRIGQWSYISACYLWGLGLEVALAVGVALEGRRPAGASLVRVRLTSS